MKKTKSILKHFSYLREYTVLSDIKATVDGKEYSFDTLMIGGFGVLSLTTFNKKGELFGNPEDENFILVTQSKTKREKVENLIKKAQDCEYALRKILSSNGLYKIKIDSGIVMEHSLSAPMIPTDIVPVYTPKTLKKQLNCGRYDMDYKFNTAAMVKAITSAK